MMFLSRRMIVPFGVTIFMLKRTNAAQNATNLYAHAINIKTHARTPPRGGGPAPGWTDEHKKKFSDTVKGYFDVAINAHSAHKAANPDPCWNSKGNAPTYRGEGYEPDKIDARRVRHEHLMADTHDIDDKTRFETCGHYKNAANAKHKVARSEANAAMDTAMGPRPAAGSAAADVTKDKNKRRRFKKKLRDRIERAWVNATRQEDVSGCVNQQTGEYVRPGHSDFNYKPDSHLTAAVKKFFTKDELAPKPDILMNPGDKWDEPIERYLYKTYASSKPNWWINGWVGDAGSPMDFGKEKYEAWDAELLRDGAAHYAH